MKAKIDIHLLKELKPADKPFDVWDTQIPEFLLRVRPGGVMTYFCSFRRPDGRRTRIAIGRTTKLTPAEARIQARVLFGQIHQGQDPVADRRRARASTLRVFLDEHYGPWVRAQRKRGADNPDRIESCFDEFLEKPLEDITAWLVEKWRVKRRVDKKAPATVNRDIAVLKAVMSKAVEWSLLKSNPLATVKPLKLDSRGVVRFLSDDEATELMKALDDHQEKKRAGRERGNKWRRDRGVLEMPSYLGLTYVDYLKPAVILSRATGLRQGELFSLTWPSVDWVREQITVTGDLAKSGQTRHVPLNAEALATLRAWWGQHGHPSAGPVFPNRAGKPLTDSKRVWKTLLRNAKIIGFRWHDMRHDFASRLAMAGVDLNTIRELLGHADIKMVLRYAHLAPHVKAKAVAALCSNASKQAIALTASTHQ